MEYRNRPVKTRRCTCDNGNGLGRREELSDWRSPAVGEPGAELVGRLRRIAGDSLQHVLEISKNIYAVPMATRSDAEQRGGGLRVSVR